MKKELLSLIILACSIGMSMRAQVSALHYSMMYNVIKDTLQIDKAYVSDSLRDSEFVGFKEAAKLIPIDTLIRMIEAPKAEYSALLHSEFNTIEDNIYMTCDNLIYFSFLYKSYICADVYLCVKTVRKNNLFPCPRWGSYRNWYSFIFQIRDDSAVLLDYFELFEL